MPVSTIRSRDGDSVARILWQQLQRDDDEAEEMEALERTLLAELGHPDPYADDHLPTTDISKEHE